MQSDIQSQYWEILNMSHHGQPQVICTVRSGNWGHPCISIDPVFLKWAYNQRTTSGIAQFLNISRDTVCNALLDYRIAKPQEAPFTLTPTETDSDNILDDFLDPNIVIPSDLPAYIWVDIQSNIVEWSTTSFMGLLSVITDEELDGAILHLHSRYWRAGITVLDGMLRCLGHRLPRECIRTSLMRVDPIQCVFQQIWIWRWVYSIPGPMSLWHHNGQHGLWACLTWILFSDTNFEPGLIQWGVIIHGFIDGYSRLVTGDEPPHQIHSYTLLFSLFLHFPYIADPPLCTSTPMQPHTIALVLAQQSHSLYRTDLAYLMDI